MLLDSRRTQNVMGHYNDRTLSNEKTVTVAVIAMNSRFLSIILLRYVYRGAAVPNEHNGRKYNARMNARITV